MTDKTPPPRFHSGGLVSKAFSLPLDQLPIKMRGNGYIASTSLANQLRIVERGHPATQPSPDKVMTFVVDDMPRNPEIEKVWSRIIQQVMDEKLARGITIALIKGLGLDEPLQAFRGMPRPMTRLHSLVLAKLEAVAAAGGA